MLGEIGDCRARYPTGDTLAGDAGQAAVAIESGKRKAACFRWGCNKRLRGAFCTLADSTRHWHPWAQDLYAAARARGRDHPRALRTVGRAWCRIDIDRLVEDQVEHILAPDPSTIPQTLAGQLDHLLRGVDGQAPIRHELEPTFGDSACSTPNVEQRRA